MCGLDFCLERFRGSERRQAKQPDVVSRCEEGLKTDACYIDDDDDDDNVDKSDDDDDDDDDDDNVDKSDDDDDDDDNVDKSDDDNDDDDADALRKTDHY